MQNKIRRDKKLDSVASALVLHFAVFPKKDIRLKWLDVSASVDF